MAVYHTEDCNQRFANFCGTCHHSVSFTLCLPTPTSHLCPSSSHVLCPCCTVCSSSYQPFLLPAMFSMIYPHCHFLCLHSTCEASSDFSIRAVPHHLWHRHPVSIFLVVLTMSWYVFSVHHCLSLSCTKTVVCLFHHYSWC